jgi:hypothetical protein
MAGVQRPANATGPHARKANEWFAFVAPASHHLKRQASKPQGGSGAFFLSMPVHLFSFQSSMALLQTSTQDRQAGFNDSEPL